MAFAHLLEEAAAADAARARAYALDCTAWNTALFIGEMYHASPTIAGGFSQALKHFELIRVVARNGFGESSVKRTVKVDLVLRAVSDTDYLP